MKYSVEKILELQPGDKIKTPTYQNSYKAPNFPNYTQNGKNRNDPWLVVKDVERYGNTVKVYCENTSLGKYVTASQILEINTDTTYSSIEGFQKKRIKLQEEIKGLKEKIDAIDSKIAYLKETGKDKFILKEFQAYEVLRVIEEKKDLSRAERADLIAKLVT